MNLNWALFSLDWSLASLHNPRPKGSSLRQGAQVSCLYSKCFSTRGSFYPQDTLGDVWRHLDITPEWGLLLASGEWRPGILLIILQCRGQSPKQRTIQSQLSLLLRLRHPARHHSSPPTPICRAWPWPCSLQTTELRVWIFYHNSWILGILLFVSIVLGLLKGAHFGRKPELLYMCLRT